MKITTLSAVLCLAAATTAANVNRASYDRPYINSLERRDGPKGVMRHENQKGHDEHHVEAHKDGPGRHGKSKAKEDEDNESSDKDEKDSGNKKQTEGDKSENEEKSSGDKEASDNKKGGDKAENGGKAPAGGKDGDNTPAGEKDGSNTPAGGKDGGNAPAGGKDGGNAPAGGKDGGNTPAGGKDGGNAPAGGKDGGNAPAGGSGDQKAGGTSHPSNDPSIPRDYASPLWLIQPFGSSVWEQGRPYVVTWGPNPDPVYAKAIEPKSGVDIHLMQGPPTALHEVAALANGVDESKHSYQWTVPTSVTPAKDYTIRISQNGKLDTYSHYFEVVKAGDPRSTKSNVGEPIVLPQKGDLPQPLDKKPIKPQAPPNPFPEDKAKDSPSKPAAGEPAAKPATHTSSASETRSANMLALAMTLFGAVYFL